MMTSLARVSAVVESVNNDSSLNGNTSGWARDVVARAGMSMLAAGARMETSDIFRGEPAKGGEFGPEMLTIATKKGPPH